MASYAYDVLDNLNTVHVTGGSQARNHTYVYDMATRRLSQLTNTVGGAVVSNLTYEVQGNLAGKGAQTYQFDLGNRLRSVPGQEKGYEYDGHGRRVFAQTVGGGEVLSQYGNDGKLLYQNDARHGRRTDFVYLGNRLVAYRERPLSSSTATLKYQHVDALGTPVAVTNAAKTTIETGEYEPYGRLVNRPLFDGPGYTGHVQDAATGLTYMQQRYYDPLLGVFLRVDPVEAYDGPMRQFHRYRYAFNNPYRFIDPDGQMPECAPSCSDAEINACLDGRAKGFAALMMVGPAIGATAAVVSTTGAGAATLVLAGRLTATAEGRYAATGILSLEVGAAIRSKIANAYLAAVNRVYQARASVMTGEAALASMRYREHIVDGIEGAASQALGVNTPPRSTAEAVGTVVVGAIETVTETHPLKDEDK